MIEKTHRGEWAEAPDREPVLRASREAWTAFLERAREYGLLDKEQEEMWERLGAEGDRFEAVQAGIDAGRRRQMRIARFKAEKEIKAKLEVRWKIVCAGR